MKIQYVTRKACECGNTRYRAKQVANTQTWSFDRVWECGNCYKQTPYIRRAKASDMVLTASQKLALEDLLNYGACSASDSYRHAFEALVGKGLAVKHWIGRGVTYALDTEAYALFKKSRGTA